MGSNSICPLVSGLSSAGCPQGPSMSESVSESASFLRPSNTVPRGHTAVPYLFIG